MAGLQHTVDVEIYQNWLLPDAGEPSSADGGHCYAAPDQDHAHDHDHDHDHAHAHDAGCDDHVHESRAEVQQRAADNELPCPRIAEALACLLLDKQLVSNPVRAFTNTGDVSRWASDTWLVPSRPSPLPASSVCARHHRAP